MSKFLKFYSGRLSTIICLIALVGFLFISCKNQIVPEFTTDYQKETIRIKDSISSAEYSFYWFYYDNGVYGETRDFISYQNSSLSFSPKKLNENIFIASNSISSFKLMNAHILINFDSQDFETYEKKFPKNIDVLVELSD